jgi:hypothetical protein
VGRWFNGEVACRCFEIAAMACRLDELSAAQIHLEVTHCDEKAPYILGEAVIVTFLA